MQTLNSERIAYHLVNAEIMQEMREKFQDGNPSPLMLLVHFTRMFKSTDARDKIFALLGIAGDAGQLPFKPDYQDSIETVFIKATTFLLSTDQWFQILTM